MITILISFHITFCIIVYNSILTKRLFFANNLLWILFTTFFPLGGIFYLLIGASSWRRTIPNDIGNCCPLKTNLLKNIPKEWKSLTSATYGSFSLTSGILKINTDYETYEEIFKAIDCAKKYIIITTYIFRPDQVGNLLLKKLQKAHKSGVTVLFLLNSIKDLRVKKLDFYVADFGNKNKFQYINIVQHSKFLLTDEIGFVFSGNFWRRVNPTDKTLPKTGQERPTTNIGCKITGDLVHDLFLLFDILWRNSKVLLGNTQNSYIALKEIKIYLEHLPKTKNHSENILGRVVFRGEGSSFLTWKNNY